MYIREIVHTFIYILIKYHACYSKYHACNQEVYCMSRRCCYSRHRVEPQLSLRAGQVQGQAQDQDQDQDQYVRNIFRDIGNGDVHVEIDNVSVAVAVLVALGFATGVIDAQALRGYLDRLLATAD